MSARTNGWSHAKTEVRLRDKNECCLCGYTRDLEVHHIIPFCECQHNETWNLMTVCEDCHVLVNGNKYSIYEFKNRQNQEKQRKRLKEILSSDKNPKEKLNSLVKWSKGKRCKVCSSDLIRIRKYLNKLIKLDYSVKLCYYFKANGNVALFWECDK